MRYLILLVLATLQLTAAGDLPLAKPEAAGMSSARLNRITAWIDGMIERKQAAGFVTLVARHGKVVHFEARGNRGMSLKDPMPKDALFDVASMTKPITVVAAMTLLEEGRYALNEPILGYLPEFKNPQVKLPEGVLEPADREITVRDLLNHTSGVSDPRSRAETFAFPTLEAYIKDVARLPLADHPGRRWIYGDSHDVLGYLVQVASGQPLDQYVQQTVLTPLGMEDTHYWPPASTDSRRAMLVVNGKDDPTSESRRPLAAAKAATFVGGASGIYTSAADYWRLCQMLLDGGVFEGKRILGPRTVSWLAQDHLAKDAVYDRPGTRFGLGFAVVTEPGKLGWPQSNGNYYWGGSQGTVFWIDPAEDLTAVLMVQVVPGGDLKLREKFAALVYSSIIE
jgi:CubicO group peptidase (beta-lactamase class C family)